jgi:hypothetical protein
MDENKNCAICRAVGLQTKAQRIIVRDTRDRDGKEEYPVCTSHKAGEILSYLILETLETKPYWEA